jgi:predicted lipoprotein with Yx(FWY)xxD motif
VQFGGTVVTATDFFSPSNNVFLDAKDFDLGSGAPLGLPSPYFGTGAIPHLLVEVGKEGVVYLIDRDHLGGMGQGPEGSDDVVQEIKGTGGLWGSMAAWPGDGGYVYVPATGPGATGTGGDEGPLEVFQYGLDPEGRPHLSLIATSQEPLHYHSGSPVVTSDGASNGSGVVWIPRCPAPGCEGSTLDAYAAVPQAGHPPLLWRGSIGVSTRFSRPGVGDGRIYVGTYDGHVLGFGSTATQHTLAVAKSGGGAGAVSSNFGGIDCGASCSHAFAEGTHLTLTATPTAHSEFAGFSGGGCSGTGTCEVTIEADTAVTANFTVTQHTLTVARSGSGAGTVSSEPAGINCGPTCSHQFSEGGTVTLSATPSHSTVSWSGCTTATANTCHVEDLQANGNITATFAQDRPALGEEAASSLGRDAATLSGAVNPNGAATTCRFEYGASESYGTTLPCSFNPGSGASPVAVTAPALSGLAAATAFHYRLDATNSGGTTKGTDHTFTTLPDTCATNAALCPSALIPPAISQPAPVAKPLRCRKGFRKRRVHGKARCTKRTKIVAKEARNQNLGQTILTTTKGLTLYSLSVERNGKFTCTRSSGCLSVWHPLTVPTKTVPTGPVKLGTVKRPDGGVQVTYHGHPLYSFGGDAEPGQANGEGIVDVGIWTAAVAPTPKR